MTFVYALSHFLFPGHTNNHKAKILHSSSIFFLALLLVVYRIVLQSVPLTGIRILGYAANIPPEEIIRLTNEKRKEFGAPSLSYNAQLAEAARKKGEHMLANDYWAHVAPDGTEPWKFFIDAGYKYRFAGENLARDFSNPVDAVNAWLASPSHRENMLSSKYKDIGVAVVEGDLGGVETTIIVQFFGTSLGEASQQVPLAQAKPSDESTPPLFSPTPTSSPTQAPIVAMVSPKPSPNEQAKAESNQKEARDFEILISPFDTTRGISIATTIILVVVMIMDAVIIKRRRVPRVGGRTFAHLAFFGMVLAILLIAKAGEIL